MITTSLTPNNQQIPTVQKETPARGGRRAGDAIPGGVGGEDCRASTIRVKSSVAGVQATG